MPETQNALDRIRAELARRADRPPDMAQARRIAAIYAAAALRRARAEQREARSETEGEQ